MNVPKLRFKEFTDEWSFTSFNEIFSILNGYAFSSKDFISSQEIILTKIANVDFNCMSKDNLSFLPKEYLNKYSKFILNRNDIIIALTRPILNNNLKIAIVDDFFDKSLLNQRVGKIISKHNSLFVYYMLQTKKCINSINISIAGTDPPNLSPEKITYIKKYLPQSKEQNKIANFLTTVDKKITNLENTITSLENQKKGLLQQIFSQKLRFKDKNGNNYPNWEEKLFSDIFSFLSTNSYSRTEMNEYHGTVKNIHYGDVLIKFNHIIDLSKHQLPYLINYNSLPKEILKEQLNKQLIKNGDIVIADTAEDYTAGKVCEVINVNDNLIVSGLHTMLCRPKPNLFSLGFLGYFMNSYTYHHQLLKLITGTKVYSIIKKEIIKTKILIPCLEEQTKIADFLSAFDRKLDNQKAQLEHWKQIKKGLLQQMFV